jgi:hypothetical protein
VYQIPVVIRWLIFSEKYHTMNLSAQKPKLRRTLSLCVLCAQSCRPCPSLQKLTYSLLQLTMEAVRTTKSSVYFYETIWRYIPEGCVIFILAAVRT